MLKDNWSHPVADRWLPRRSARSVNSVGAEFSAKANAQTGASPEPQLTQKEFFYQSYVDEVVSYVVTQGGATQRYYPHYNHLWSAAALTDSTGQVVERYKYEAMGRMTITSATGVVRSQSSVGWDRGFSGYLADRESGLLYARERMYSPSLGRFIERDPNGVHRWSDPEIQSRLVGKAKVRYAGGGRFKLPVMPGPKAQDGYQDGMSLYAGYFAPNSTDPFGLNPCDGYSQFIPSKCTKCFLWEYYDGYPAKARDICNAFRQMYNNSEEVDCVASCLVEAEGNAQKWSSCKIRNGMRLGAHVSCYALCGFIPTNGLPPGAAEVGWGDLLPSITDLP